MENQKIGSFIAAARKEKEMTQLDLAKRLNVTDKAISKWERGLGFPDIKLLKPLAEALDVSVMELMNGEFTSPDELSSQQAITAVNKVIDEAVYRRKLDRKGLLAIISVFVATCLLICLLDLISWNLFVMFYLPLTLGVIGLVLITIAIIRACRHKKFWLVLIFGLLALAVPLSYIIIFFLAIFLIGGPIPS